MNFIHDVGDRELSTTHNQSNCPLLSTYTSCFKEDKQLPTSCFFGTNFEKCSTPYIHATFFEFHTKLKKTCFKKININDVYCLFLCHFSVLKTHTRTQPHEVKYQGGSRSFVRKPTKQNMLRSQTSSQIFKLWIPYEINFQFWFGIITPFLISICGPLVE